MKWKFNYRLLRQITAFTLIGLVIFRVVVINIIDVTIRKQLDKIRQPGITVDYSGLSIGWISSSVNIGQIEIIGMGQSDTAIHISVEHMLIQDVRLRELFIQKKILVGRISLDKTTISSKTGQHLEWKDFPEEKDFKPGLVVTSDELRFKNFQWNHYDERDTLAMTAGSERFSVLGLKYRSKASMSERFTFDSIGCREFSFTSPAIQHKFTVGSLDFSQAMKELDIGEVRVVPLLDKIEFANYFKRQVDRIECYTKKIQLTGVSYLDDGHFYLKARKMDFDLHMETFRNKTYPFLREKFSLLPREMLKKTGFPFDIDTFALDQGFIAYEELDSLYYNPGRIYFNELRIRANHLSNDPKYGGNTIFASSNFMESGAIKAEFYFPEDTAGKYTVKGVLSPMNLSELNGIMKAASLFEVRTGTLDTMTFEIFYDKTKAKGKVEFAFSDLKLTAYKKKSPDKISLMRTFVANQVIRMNKVKNASLTGIIDYQRNPVRSVVFNWWRSLFSGIKAAFVKDGTIRPNRNKKNELDVKFDED